MCVCVFTARGKSQDFIFNTCIFRRDILTCNYMATFQYTYESFTGFEKRPVCSCQSDSRLFAYCLFCEEKKNSPHFQEFFWGLLLFFFFKYMTNHRCGYHMRNELIYVERFLHFQSSFSEIWFVRNLDVAMFQSQQESTDLFLLSIKHLQETVREMGTTVPHP